MKLFQRILVTALAFVVGIAFAPLAHDPMWMVQVSVLNTRNKITTYRTGYHKYDGCPLSAIGFMMDIHAAIRKILKSSRKELEKERNEKKNKENYQ